VTTTENVVDILVTEGGYRELPKPFNIGSLSFDFTHALVAGNRANDLVIVIEITGDTADDIITRKIFSLTRALDVMKSKRPVTAILTSGQPGSNMIRSIGRVCRVLPVGVQDSYDSLREWLSALLPLQVPEAVDIVLDWEEQLRNRPIKSDLYDELIATAPDGSVAVEKVLSYMIGYLIEPVLNEDEDRE